MRVSRETLGARRSGSTRGPVDGRIAPAGPLMHNACVRLGSARVSSVPLGARASGFRVSSRVRAGRPPKRTRSAGMNGTTGQWPSGADSSGHFRAPVRVSLGRGRHLGGRWNPGNGDLLARIVRQSCRPSIIPERPAPRCCVSIIDTLRWPSIDVWAVGSLSFTPRRIEFEIPRAAPSSCLPFALAGFRNPK